MTIDKHFKKGDEKPMIGTGVGYLGSSTYLAGSSGYLTTSTCSDRIMEEIYNKDGPEIICSDYVCSRVIDVI